MERLKKYTRFLKKIIRGQNPLAISLPQAHWDRQFTKGYWEFLLDTPKNTAAIVRYLAEKYKGKHISILDVGCGNGIIPKLLAETDLDFSYTGTDISAAALQQAKEYCPAGKFINQGMEKELSIDQHFDVVIFSEVLLYGNAKKTLQVHRKFFASDTLIIISLYKHWRTRVIWWLINRYFKFVDHLKPVGGNGIAWNIKMGFWKQYDK